MQLPTSSLAVSELESCNFSDSNSANPWAYKDAIQHRSQQNITQQILEMKEKSKG